MPKRPLAAPPSQSSLRQRSARSLAAAGLFAALSGCASLGSGTRDEGEADTERLAGAEPTFLQVSAHHALAEETKAAVTAPPALIEESVPAPEEIETAIADELPLDDVWERIRRGMAMQDHSHERIAPFVDWYARHQNYLDRVAERARPYIHHIVESIEARGMPTELALLPVVESAYYPFAYSHGRASGIWQFIPMTGRRFNLEQDWWYDGRRDVYASTRAALDYLEYLNGFFDGDWLLALAAYNAGEGTVRRAVHRNRNAGRPTDFWSLDLPRETRNYVPKLLGLSHVVAAPQEYGLTLQPIANEPYFARVDVGSQIDLALAAELAELPLERIYQLNPGFNRWATRPDGPHYLLLPLEVAEDFQARLAELAPEQRIQWQRHRIRPGENLGAIARRYNTTVGALQETNGLRGHVIRAGDDLLIPVASRPEGSYALSASERQRAAAERPRGGQRVDHTVRRGDTLWNLARTHGVNVRDLARWNSMAPTDPLMPGRRLVIWSQRAGASPAVARVPAGPAQQAVTQRIGYTVRRGDSLARISQRFNVTIRELREWNGLQEGRHIHPGQRLTLYVDVTRQSGG
ncbi:LysM peptidoglycan-binding domain-containing protein [Ectothiorhodospiraceae bacterium 2226]|nr:LysM peptidoglycan-binding domain-containing protein [Ectothiorhodospiraceae bacterium 2226]